MIEKLAFVLIALGFWGSGHATSLEYRAERIQSLSDALATDDFEAFATILDEGALDPSAFSESSGYEVLCAATRPGRLAFLQRLLNYGANPSAVRKTGHPLFRSPLVCASTEYHIAAYDLLLDAGADTTINLCPECAEPETPFIAVIRMPPFSSRILERRRLMPSEINVLTWRLENVNLMNSHNGQPTYEWYQDVLREYGVDNLDVFSTRNPE